MAEREPGSAARVGPNATGANATTTYRHPRLNELARLEADWDSYGAPPLTEAALTAADRLVFIPTGDGGVQIELHTTFREVDIVINGNGEIEYVYLSGEIEVDHDR